MAEWTDLLDLEFQLVFICSTLRFPAEMKVRSVELNNISARSLDALCCYLFFEQLMHAFFFFFYYSLCAAEDEVKKNIKACGQFTFS